LPRRTDRSQKQVSVREQTRQSKSIEIEKVATHQAVTAIAIQGVTSIHLFLHFVVPCIIAAAFFRKAWTLSLSILLLTMLVDLDHLLANPIYDANRCSINFHPLHGFIPIVSYFAFCFFPKTRLLGIGLIIHMGLDSIDCQFTNGIWFNPF